MPQRKVNRSAISGRFVKDSTPKRNPKTTVTETVKGKGGSKGRLARRSSGSPDTVSYCSSNTHEMAKIQGGK